MRIATKHSVVPAAAATAGSLTFGLWYRLFRRPLPQTQGKLTLAGLQAPARILRDRYGVPHVRARTIEDLAFAEGFCHGQDRLFQMEFYKRVVNGRLSEFVGTEGLPVDRLMRTLGLARAARTELAAAPKLVSELLTAYSAGVNAAAANVKALPIEMQIARFEPTPWTPADTLAIYRLMALGLATNWEMELFRAEILSDFGSELLARLEPQYPRTNPVVVKPGETFTGHALDMAEQINAVRESIGLGREPAGSNNWAVSGERSATGMPLLASDPHLTAGLPNLFYQIHLADDQATICGGTTPGTLGVPYGQTEHVAWSFTNAMADTMDLFIERIREAEDGTTEYEFKGQWHRAKVFAEEIRVKGQAKPELLEVVVTRHGPLVNSALGAREDQPLALEWTALEQAQTARGPALATFGRAGSGAELVEMMSDYSAPALNMVWADSAGNIGYKLVGHLPLRTGHAPDIPKPGWTGEFEWEGLIPYEELPSVTNPESGFVVTANNRIVDSEYPYHITSEWFNGYRARRIEDMLADREQHSIADFERMQVDLYSIPGVETADRLCRLKPSDDRAREALELLSGWDGVMDAETVAGTVVHAFLVNFARSVSTAMIGDRELADRYMSKSAAGVFAVVSSPWRFLSRILELWEEADEQAIGGASWNELALEALDGALEELEDRFGKNRTNWQWGKVHGLYMAHPFGQSNRLLDRLFSRSVRAGGSTETVAQIGYVPTDPYRGVWAPCYRMLADLGDPNRSRWQLPGGQSGHVGSKHYDDLLEPWLKGRTQPVFRTEIEAEAAGEAQLLELEP